LATTTIGFGVVLIVLGLAGFLGTGSEHQTALIPAVFGILLAVLGAMARDDNKRKLAMHIAVTVGLLGFLGTVSALFQLGDAMSGAAAQPMAVYAKSVMAVLMLIYVAMCVKSFIDARKRRTAGA